MENTEHFNCNTKRKLKFTINNETVNDNQTIANEFNHFYVSIEIINFYYYSIKAMLYVDNIMNSIVISSCLLYNYEFNQAIGHMLASPRIMGAF